MRGSDDKIIKIVLSWKNGNQRVRDREDARGKDVWMWSRKI